MTSCRGSIGPAQMTTFQRWARSTPSVANATCHQRIETQLTSRSVVRHSSTACRGGLVGGLVVAEGRTVAVTSQMEVRQPLFDAAGGTCRTERSCAHIPLLRTSDGRQDRPSRGVRCRTVHRHSHKEQLLKRAVCSRARRPQCERSEPHLGDASRCLV
jgi:hypothetical protein